MNFLLRQIQHICMVSVYARIYYPGVNYDAYGDAVAPIVKGEYHNETELEKIIANADLALKQLRKELRTALIKDIKKRDGFGDEFDQNFSLTMQDYIVAALVEKEVADFTDQYLSKIRKSIKCDHDVPANADITDVVDDADDTAVNILNAFNEIDYPNPLDPYIFRKLATALVNTFK